MASMCKCTKHDTEDLSGQIGQISAENIAPVVSHRLRIVNTIYECNSPT